MSAKPKEVKLPEGIAAPSLSIGGDPEIFAVQRQGICLIPMKEFPTAVAGSFTNSITNDGAQLELHPASQACRSFFVDAVRNCMLMALPLANARRATLQAVPAIPVSLKMLRQFPQSALEFGCDPDYEAYHCNVNVLPRSVDAAKHPWRYGGGHIHIGGYLEVLHAHAPAIIRMCDVIPGLLHTAFGLQADLARKRRKLFGSAGTFRIQPHGLEYRALDNSWLLHPKLTMLFAGLTVDAVKLTFLGEKGSVQELFALASTVRDIVNEFDIQAARTLWQREVAPRLETLYPYNSNNVSIKYPTGRSELVWATEILESFTTHLERDLHALRGHLSPEWHFELGPTKNRTPWFWHATYCKGGFEPFFNETLLKAYNHMHEQHISYEDSEMDWKLFTAPAKDPRCA